MTINLRKHQVRRRYGDASDRTVDRMVRDFRIPKPDYFGNKVPFWGEAKLDQNDRVLAAQSQDIQDRFKRLLAEIAAAPTPDDARTLLETANAAGDLAGLTDAQLAGLRDAAGEKPDNNTS
jgi:hypothetical protein